MMQDAAVIRPFLDGRRLAALDVLDGRRLAALDVLNTLDVPAEILACFRCLGPRSMPHFRRARMQGGGNAGGPTRALDVDVRGFARTRPLGSTLDTLDGAGRAPPRNLPRGRRGGTALDRVFPRPLAPRARRSRS
ncbi:hypothetical protein [Polyangium fumosum]|uniref:Uncharacterized protein n=1 Tax=Polyangium fumosum TaxID=889272 RepID=A0A4V5PKX7_9BACT|nr:hypothetical protein [Polyangium fumosum]TKC89840.1 hypothetical protein E8A74_51295 [Polyangium fumosum]